MVMAAQWPHLEMDRQGGYFTTRLEVRQGPVRSAELKPWRWTWRRFSTVTLFVLVHFRTLSLGGRKKKPPSNMQQQATLTCWFSLSTGIQSRRGCEMLETIMRCRNGGWVSPTFWGQTVFLAACWFENSQSSPQTGKPLIQGGRSPAKICEEMREQFSQEETL